MILKEEKGLAMPLVLMIVVVLSMLGVVFMEISIADTVQVANNANRMKAYYLARAGADATASGIISNPNIISSIVNKSSDPVAFGDGTFKITNITINSNKLNIQSTGTVNGVSQATTLILTQLSANDIFNNAILAIKGFDIPAMEVKGNLESSTGTITPPNDFDNNKYHVKQQSNRSMQQPTFPTLPTDPNGVNIDKEDVTLDLNQKYAYNNITLQPSNTLTFNTGDDSKNILQVVVNNLDCSGTIMINGKGSVFLYVNTSATFRASKNYPINSGSPSSLFIFLGQDSNLDIKSNKPFNGYIYGPQATVTMESAQTIISGAIVTENFQNNSNPSVTHIDVSNAVDISSTIKMYKRAYWQ